MEQQPSEDDPNFKPYQCRFCTMKFAKSQALGGHMNRHRQEREREQLQNAQTLLLRQQQLPHYLAAGPACASGGLAGDLGPHRLPRSSSDNSLRDGVRMSSATMPVGSIGRNFQTGEFHHAVSAPSFNWTQGAGLESPMHTASAFNLDPMLQSYHAARPRFSMPSNSPASSCFIRPPNLPDQLLNPSHYDKQVQLSSFPFDANSHSSTRLGESLLSQHLAQTHSQGGSFLANTPNAATFVPQMNQRCVQWRSPELAFQEDLGQPLAQQSKPSSLASIHNGYHHHLNFAEVDSGARPSLLVNQPMEFGANTQIPCEESLTSWTPTRSSQLSPSMDNQQEADNAEHKIDADFASAADDEPNTTRSFSLALQPLLDNYDSSIDMKIKAATSDYQQASSRLNNLQDCQSNIDETNLAPRGEGSN